MAFRTYSTLLATATAFAFGVGLATPTLALTATSFSGGDGAFNALCAVGNGRGSGNQKCEFAIGEMRGGDRAGSAEWEVDARDITDGNAGPNAGQFDWGNGTATSFVFSFLSGTLSLSVDDGTSSVTSSRMDVDLGGTASLFIRTRSEGGDNPGTVSLSNMSLNGMALPDLSAPGVGSDGAGYLQVSGIDWTSNWTLQGDTTFAWSNELPRGSRMNVNFKLTDIAPIPLPAAGWLLFAGLGGLGVLARRRRNHLG